MIDLLTGIYALLGAFLGYIIGNTIGYTKGIESAARIWQDSFSRMSKAMFQANCNKDKTND